MPAFSTAVIQGYLAAGDAAATMPAKGKALEELACYLFGLIPGVSITERNAMNSFDTEEIDVACWNEQDPAGLKSFNALILVECKNWSKAVGSQEVSWFLTKIEHRSLDFGILLAVNGVTGDANDGKQAHHLISMALLKKVRLIVITRSEIEQLTHTDELVTLIRKKVCQLVVSGTVWP
ncbi:restriction endonuclease [Symmachiella dynata]|uniref:restriction endonuclease n=1 Tax=Symmachiella dynata TaxID=2527995 RepID=UPI0030EDD09E